MFIHLNQFEGEFFKVIFVVLFSQVPQSFIFLTMFTSPFFPLTNAIKCYLEPGFSFQGLNSCCIPDAC